MQIQASLINPLFALKQLPTLENDPLMRTSNKILLENKIKQLERVLDSYDNVFKPISKRYQERNAHYNFLFSSERHNQINELTLKLLQDK